MITIERKNKDQSYVCEECGFAYDDKFLTKECEKFCKEKKSCNIKINKYAVEI